MKGIDGHAGDIDAITITIRTPAGFQPDPADLLQILTYRFQLRVNGNIVFQFKLDQARDFWSPQALVLVYEPPTPSTIAETDDVGSTLSPPPDQPPGTVHSHGGLKITCGIHSKTIIEKSQPELRKLFESMGIRFEKP